MSRGPDRTREGLQDDEDAQAAYVIGLDALATLYHRLASDGGLPLSWAIQGMLDALDGRCQLDVQARERVRSRWVPGGVPSMCDSRSVDTDAMNGESTGGTAPAGPQTRHGQEAMGRARRWHRWGLGALWVGLGVLLLHAMGHDDVLRLLQAAMR